MKNAFLTLLAVVGVFAGVQAKADIGCSYSFDSRTSSSGVTIQLDIEGTVYKHSCAYDSKKTYEDGSSMFFYYCASQQNLNVITFLGVEVSEGYVWNSYKNAALLKNPNDGADVLAVCKRK